MRRKTAKTAMPAGPAVHYQNRRGIRVTDHTLSTRYKDEALAPIQSVQIGREPLLIGFVVGAGLTAFAYSFADLLYGHEQQLLLGVGIAILLTGYVIVPLKVGQYMHERTALWSTIWTANAVRRAIAKAKSTHETSAAPIALPED